MVNKVNNFKHQATGWDHFRAKEMSARKEASEHNKKPNKVFSWIMKTINPINHIPVIGTIKNLNSKAEKSLDIVQSAIGGMIYGGPYGFLKGIGSWIVGKVVGKKEIVSKVLPDKKQKIKENESLHNNSINKDADKLTNISTSKQLIKISSKEKIAIDPLVNFNINKSEKLIKDLNLHYSKKAMQLYSNKENIINKKNINVSA